MNLDAFYENQKQAVCHKESPCLVVAGPGSGKTTVIIHRVKNLIEQNSIPAAKILVITFTKAAANEMRNRFLTLMGQTISPVTFATFHSLFFRILRNVFGYTTDQIVSEEEKWRLLRGFMIEFDIETNDREEAVRSFLSGLSLMKSEMTALTDFLPEGLSKADFQKLYQEYEAYKQRNEKLDFDDMLTSCYQLLQENERVRTIWQQRFSFILVDEFQDANKVQYETIKVLAKPKDNLFVVGDDDQSIYAFRGARPDLLLAFTKDYPQATKITLNRNFRSTEKIVKLSEKIINHNQSRLEKNMVSARGQGSKTVLLSSPNTVEEGKKIVEKIGVLHQQGVALSQIAVICRTNIQGGLYGALLADRGIAYILKDKGINPWSHWITQDILAYLSLAMNQEDDEAVRRIINKPKRYISKAILQQAQNLPYPLLRSLPICDFLKVYQQKGLQELSGHLGEIRRKSPHKAIVYIRKIIGYDGYLQEYANFTRANIHGYLEIVDEVTELAKGIESFEGYIQKIHELDEIFLAKGSEKETTEGVTVSTMHSAKGLEFQAVFIPSVVEGVLPHEKTETLAQLEEERRLFYVAVTRAKEYLYLSEVKSRHDRDAIRSRFLKELGIR